MNTSLIPSANELNDFQLFAQVAVSKERETCVQVSLTFRSKQASTVCTEKVLWVPGLVQRCQDVLEK